MRQIRAILVDDEAPARDELRYLLGSLGGVDVVGEAVTGPEALDLTARLSPDVIFLDVAMPGADGIEVARRLLDSGDCPRIVFVTAYEEYAVRAFEVSAADYLLKPFNSERLASTLRNIRKTLEDRSRGSLDDHVSRKVDRLLEEVLVRFPNVKVPAMHKGSTILLDAHDLVYVRCSGGEVFLKTFDKEYHTRLTLSAVQDRLGRRFLRVHRSFLVNLDMVSEVIPWFSGTYTLAVRDKEGSRVPVARSQVREMKDALGI